MSVGTQNSQVSSYQKSTLRFIDDKQNKKFSYFYRTYIINQRKIILIGTILPFISFVFLIHENQHSFLKNLNIIFIAPLLGYVVFFILLFFLYSRHPGFTHTTVIFNSFLFIICITNRKF